jgi:hypothetical protein
MAIFRCETCDYSTSVKCNYAKHLLTEKHRSPKSINVHFSEPPIPDSTPNATATTANDYQPPYLCSECGRKYRAQRSLWRHSKICKTTKPPNLNNPNSINSSIYDKFASTVTELCKSNVELSKMNQLQQTQIHEMYNHFMASLQNQSHSVALQNSAMPTYSQSNVTTNNLQSLTVNGNLTNNSNNKTFHINMFLNEKCKDAMNMTDFVKNIELDTDDMRDVGKYGFVKGISKIFIDNLEKTEVTKRPIHCTDSKREILYIKDDNKWEREGIHSKKLINAIHSVEHKNVVLVNEWAKTHPQCENSETQANQIYMTLAKHAHDGDDDNVMKVAKRIAKTVIVSKNDE